MNVKDKPTINVRKREIVGKEVKVIRREGFIPAVLYGQGVDNENLSLPEKEFIKLYKDAGGSTIVLLKVEGEDDRNVLVHSIDKHSVTDRILHVDFYRVNMNKKITAKVPLHFVGDSKAVREMDGSLITNKTEIEVECLPGDLPHEIEISIEALEDFDKTIHVKDIKAPEGVTILGEEEETVITVEPPRSEEEMAELEETIGDEIPEEEKEAEEGETEEGEKEEGGEAPKEGGGEENKEE